VCVSVCLCSGVLCFVVTVCLCVVTVCLCVCVSVYVCFCVCLCLCVRAAVCPYLYVSIYLCARGGEGAEGTCLFVCAQGVSQA